MPKFIEWFRGDFGSEHLIDLLKFIEKE